jgi:AcrR family transcriptional regulator
VPKVSQEYRDARRAQILDAARRCFLRDGFHETSMQDLFAESGLSSGAVYLYFSSKQEVIVAVAEENMRDVMAMVHDLAATRPDAGLGEELSGVLELVHKQHKDDQLGRIAVLVWAEALRNPVLAKRLDKSLRQMQADLAALVREHQARSAAPDDVTPEALAALFMTIIPGFIMQLSLFGPRAMAGVRDAVQTVWPT